jgi:hypothetical protein
MSLLCQPDCIFRSQRFFDPSEAARCRFQERLGELASEFVVAAADVVQSLHYSMVGGLGQARDGRESGLEFGLADGFGEVVVEARGEAALTIALHGVGRQGQNLHVVSPLGLALTYGPDCLETVHPGHLQVHEDDIEVIGLERFERLESVRGNDH